MPLAASSPPANVLQLAVFQLLGTCVRLQEQMEGYYSTAALELVPGISSVFRWCRKNGVKIYLVSELNEEDTHTILKRLNWNPDTSGQPGAIDGCLLVDEEATNPVRAAVESIGLSNARQTITVGDTPRFLNWSWAAGSLLNIGVTYGNNSYLELSDQPHHGLLDNILEVPQFVVEHVVSRQNTATSGTSSETAPLIHPAGLRLRLPLS